MNIEEKAAYFDALGDPVRLRIVALLLDGRCTCICDIAAAVKKDQSVVFRHVQQLARAGIVSASKDGKYLRCCVREPAKLRKLLG
jgi:ArsR family transcriptional regulator